MKMEIAQVETEPDGTWTVEIGYATSKNTFCFEGSIDGRTWVPVNAQRLSGMGPTLGSIMSNAVAGGLCCYKGAAGGFTFIRVVQTLSDNTYIVVSLTTNKPRKVYIINEEKDFEDLFNASK